MATQDGIDLEDEILNEGPSWPDIPSMPAMPLRDRFLRWLPLAAVALVGQASAAWPPGPTNPRDFWVSTSLLVVLVGIVAYRRVNEPSTWLVRVGIYITSVTFLMIATGGTSSGLGSLLLIPVVGVALYGKRWESAVLVALVVAALLGVSLATPHLLAATARRVILFAAIATMFSVAIHSLRELLLTSNERMRRLLQQEEALNSAARQLSLMIDPQAITALGVQLAARDRVAARRRSAPGGVPDDRGRGRGVGAQFDESGLEIHEKGPLEEHPPLSRAVRTWKPVVDRLDPQVVGPALRAVLTESGITHGAWVPVCPDGRLHGVLAIATRGLAVPPECVDRCVALGHLMELALSNWAAHRELEHRPPSKSVGG